MSKFFLPNFNDFSNIMKFSAKIQSSLVKKYIKKVTCGNSHCLFLTQAGMIFSIGNGEKGQLGITFNTNEKSVNEPTIVTSLLNYRVSSIASGCNHNIVLATSRDLQIKSDDTDKEQFIFVFGSNSQGQLGLENINSVDLPKRNDFFQDKKISKIDCGLNHTAILSDEEIYLFGNVRPESVPVEKPIRLDEKISGYSVFSAFQDFICSLNSMYCLSKGKF